MASDKRRDVLDERAQTLLRVLVDNYIRDGQPVGSRTLSRDSGLDLSPATIRNIMADLEELGFVTRRIPPPGAFRPTRATGSSSTRLLKLTPPIGDDRRRASPQRPAASWPADPQGAGRRRFASALDGHAPRRRRDAAAHAAGLAQPDRVRAAVR